MSEASEVQFYCRKVAEMIGWLHLKGDSRVGGSDDVFFKAGRCFCCEYKLPGKKQRHVQKEEQEIIEANGTDYRVVKTLVEFKVYLIEMQDKFFGDEE